MSDRDDEPVPFDDRRLRKLIGEALLSEAQHNPELRVKLKMIADRHITDPEHRALLGPKGLLQRYIAPPSGDEDDS